MNDDHDLPTRLPRHRERPDHVAARDVRDQVDPLPPRPTTGPPPGAPNVLVVLLDDMGFGASSAFGGPCRMPVAEQLAEDGLRYSRFHTTAMCSPTRAALMTGRNHHAVGMGNVLEISTGAPGYDGTRPRSSATIAQVLGHHGYATGAFGKWHQTPPWEQTAAGPFDRWPTHEGFDRFYGFLGGEASQFEPTLVEGTHFVDPPRSAAEGYHLSEDLVDRAIGWTDEVRTFAPDKPWFCYLAFGATHAPFQVPPEWRGRNRGDFAHGWDEQRRLTLERQRALGVVPPDADLAPWTPGVPHWEDLNEVERTNAERLMELYAAFAEHTDAQVGRLVEHLRARGELDDTLVLYVLGDNGASAEGGLEGTLNETLRLNGLGDTSEAVAAHLAAHPTGTGGPDSYVHYPVGWAVSMDTPYQWTKQVASHYGGTRNGLVVHWPAGIASRGEVRHQWHHVNDVFPTLLEAAGLPLPVEVDGVAQDPLDGVSFRYSFDDPTAGERHTTQYFEMFGNRGIFHEGWTAVTQHKTPWSREPTGHTDDDVWELYDTRTDWTQAHDVAAQHPEQLARLQELFESEAVRNQVYPLDDQLSRRFGARSTGRPQPPDRISLPSGAGRLREDAVPSLKNTSFVLAARFRTDPAVDPEGVLVVQGGGFAGWSLYLKDDRLVFAYTVGDGEVVHVRSDTPVVGGPAAATGAEHVAEVRFDYDGGGLGRGGDVGLWLDGQPVGTGRLERTVPFFFSMDQTLDIGVDRGTPVTPDYGTRDGFAFTGTVLRVDLSRGTDALAATREQLTAAVLVGQ